MLNSRKTHYEIEEEVEKKRSQCLDWKSDVKNAQKWREEVRGKLAASEGFLRRSDGMVAADRLVGGGWSSSGASRRIDDELMIILDEDG